MTATPITAESVERRRQRVAAGLVPATRITVERGETFYRTSRYPWRTDYRCTGPDGTRFQNGSKDELKRVLTRRYGKVELTFVDGPTWRTRP